MVRPGWADQYVVHSASATARTWMSFEIGAQSPTSCVVGLSLGLCGEEFSATSVATLELPLFGKSFFDEVFVQVEAAGTYDARAVSAVDMYVGQESTAVVVHALEGVVHEYSVLVRRNAPNIVGRFLAKALLLDAKSRVR